MIQNIINALYQVPEYLRSLVSGRYLIPVIVVLAVFIFVLFFSNKVADFLRRVFIGAMLVLGVIGYFIPRYQLIWVCLILLVLLAVVRLIRYIFVTVRQDRINSKIEARALAKARKRRGTWQNKQGYSGEAKPLVDGDTATSDSASAADAAAEMVLDEEVENKLNAEERAAGMPKVDYMNRKQIMDCIEKLKDLKDAGVLTEAEYNEKARDLYARLG